MVDRRAVLKALGTGAVSVGSRATVESNCGACHSLDYIPMNSPYPTAQLWQAEVTKMINALGAPINQTDAAAIIEHLSKNYGR